MQQQLTRAEIVALGSGMDPTVREGSSSIFDAEQRRLGSNHPATAADLAYGPDERHRLDIYAPYSTERGIPVCIWVHGGGFRIGSKGGADDWHNAHVGRALAKAGFLGVVINYRLAPTHVWPSGSEDLAAVVEWVKSNIHEWGGDPERIVLAGHSAGAAHVAGFLKLRPDHADAVRGAVLLSGVYGVTPIDDERDMSYFGGDKALHPDMVPIGAVVDTRLPLLVVFAEFDSPRFQFETIELLRRRLDTHGKLPRSHIVSGHNHFSMCFHIGTSDTRLTDEIVSFIRDVCA